MAHTSLSITGISFIVLNILELRCVKAPEFFYCVGCSGYVIFIHLLSLISKQTNQCQSKSVLFSLRCLFLLQCSAKILPTKFTITVRSIPVMLHSPGFPRSL